MSFLPSRPWLVVLLMVVAVPFSSALYAAGGHDDDDGKSVSMKKVPEAVVQAVESAIPGGEIRECESEKENGVRIYELEIKTADGKEFDVKLTGDGEMLEIEKELALTDAPKAVKSAAANLFPNGKTKEVEAKTVFLYEAEVNTGAGVYTVQVNALGDIVSLGNEHEENESDEAEEKVSVDALPEAVVKACQRKAPSATIEEATKEMENGAVVFELEVSDKGLEKELEISADGEVLEIAQEVSLDEIPEAARQVLVMAFPEGSIVELEQKQYISYSIEKSLSGRTYELSLNPCGEVISLELEGVKWEDHEDDDD